MHVPDGGNQILVLGEARYLYMCTVEDELTNRRYIALGLPHSSASQLKALVHETAFLYTNSPVRT